MTLESDCQARSSSARASATTGRIELGRLLGADKKHPVHYISPKGLLVSLGAIMVFVIGHEQHTVMVTTDMKKWLEIVAVMLALTFPSTGWAGFSSEETEGLEKLLSLTALGAGLLSSAAITGLMVVTDAIDTSIKSKEWERYLRENELEVRESLMLGHGDMIDELAIAFDLDEVEHEALGRLVRRERRVLASLADPEKLTPERASQFAKHLIDAMSADDTLAGALERAASRI